ncbi:hypothetical protein E8K88_11970 [Lampropedia aestuarii]|uniref:Minor tail protein n=1 Tax=Lampropedia aestuarii TaxID=2562762 RepID=A0A4S5BJ99_9BURK|nr:hypothetical protein [Lampropedia aestuarii]THJ32410.1 hypothetical protein E8K88_11970 [Lampropedia aestuarii]
MTVFKPPEAKQPWERMDYAVTYQDWLNGGDVLEDVDAFVECITDPADISLLVDGVEFTANTAKVWIAGGTAGNRYKVTVRSTTQQQRRDESEIIITVKEY